MVVGRAPRQRDVADAQLRLRRRRAVHEREPRRRRRAATRTSSGSATASDVAAPPALERARRTASASASCDASPTAITVVRAGTNARRWKPLMSRIAQRPQRSFRSRSAGGRRDGSR